MTGGLLAGRRLVLGGGAALLSACSVLPAQKYQDRRDWPLVLRRPDALPPLRNGKVLLIRTVSAAPGMDARGIQSLQKDGSVDVGYYEQWTVSPNQAMEAGLRQWLADSGLFSAVVGPGSRVTADLILEAELTALNADLPAGVARAALSVVVLAQRAGVTFVKLQRMEKAEAPLAGTDPPALVRAMQAAAAAVMRETEDDLRTV